MAPALNDKNQRQPISWQQAVVSIAAIAGATCLVIFGKGMEEVGAAILGAAMTAAVGAFKR